MIVIVPPGWYGEHEQLLREMHRMRYRVFKERLSWKVEVKDGEERDRFDDLNPVYVIALDEAEKVVGSWRMVPTTGPYMLRDVFPELLEGARPPNDPNLWECSRFAVEYSEGHADQLNRVSRVTGEIFCGLIEYCLAAGIHEIVTVYDFRIARLLPKIGCRPYKRTKTRRIGDTITMAGFFAISESVLNEVRSANGITASVIRDAPWLRTIRAA